MKLPTKEKVYHRGVINGKKVIMLKEIKNYT